MIDIWQIGNTGVRNPMRIQAALRVYVDSPLYGNVRGVDGANALLRLMHERGILVNQPGKDGSGSYGRKFRLEFNKNGFTYDKLPSALKQSEFGAVDTLTPFGRTFLNADTVPSIQECFLRADSVAMEPLDGGHVFSPLRWTLAVLLELTRRGLPPALGFVEFATLVQTSNPLCDLKNVVDNILELREDRQRSRAKKRFDTQWYSEIGAAYGGKTGNFRDYGDMNLRYLRATGMVRSAGHGIALMPEKRSLAEKLAATQIFDTAPADRYRQLYEGAPLPTDDMTVAVGVLREVESMARRSGIACAHDGASLRSVAEVNAARHRLEEALQQQAEDVYAKDQKNRWEEIADYMDLVMRGGGRKRYGEDREITVPREEAAAYLEWCLWRAFLAINTLRNRSCELRRFKVDQDFFPVSTAPGNGPDLVAEYEHDVVAIEVTMSGGSRQEAMEGEPVRRHVADLVEKYPSKNVHGLFIANRIDTNTAETFRRGVWYGHGDVKMQLDIVPFTLEQFKVYFRWMFEAGCRSGSEVTSLIRRCGDGRDRLDAPTWKRMIGVGVNAAVARRSRLRRNPNEYVQSPENMLRAAGVRDGGAQDEYAIPAENDLATE